MFRSLLIGSAVLLACILAETSASAQNTIDFLRAIQQGLEQSGFDQSQHGRQQGVTIIESQQGGRILKRAVPNSSNMNNLGANSGGSTFFPGSPGTRPQWQSPGAGGNSGWRYQTPNQNQIYQSSSYSPYGEWSSSYQDQYPIYSPSSQYQPSHSVARPASPPSRPITYSQKPIKIRIADGELGSCDYTLTGTTKSWNYSLEPGQVHALKEDRPWKIKYFSDGKVQEFSLKGGQDYEFAREAGLGWKLYRLQ